MQKRYLRGQVWHWNDPVYGDKKDGKWVDQDEATLRYSRYVIIMQDTDMINRSCLVVPCSTQKAYDDQNEVEFYIYDTKPSYTRCQLLTPISTANLDNYICTLSDEDMDRISAMVGYVLGISEKPAEAKPAETEKQLDLQIDQVDTRVKSNKWDEPRMKIFLEDFDSHGCSETSEMYGLTEKSCRRYYSLFKQRVS